MAGPSWTSACTCTGTRTSCRARSRTLPLHPELESHLEAALWRDAFVMAEMPRARARHDQGHRPDRDDPRRLRDGRDPLRAARPRRGPERGPLGLHLLGHQALPFAARVRAARPLRGHDDRALHARLLRAARQDVPRPRRARDGRHVGRDPEPQRRGGQPPRVRGVRARQAARGRRGLRRHLGGPPGLGPRSPPRPSTRCSATGPTKSTGTATM